MDENIPPTLDVYLVKSLIRNNYTLHVDGPKGPLLRDELHDMWQRNNFSVEPVSINYHVPEKLVSYGELAQDLITGVLSKGRGTLGKIEHLGVMIVSVGIGCCTAAYLAPLNLKLEYFLGGAGASIPISYGVLRTWFTRDNQRIQAKNRPEYIQAVLDDVTLDKIVFE